MGLFPARVVLGCAERVWALLVQDWREPHKQDDSESCDEYRENYRRLSHGLSPVGGVILASEAKDVSGEL